MDSNQTGIDVRPLRDGVTMMEYLIYVNQDFLKDTAHSIWLEAEPQIIASRRVDIGIGDYGE
jgi:hypothetical protein